MRKILLLFILACVLPVTGQSSGKIDQISGSQNSGNQSSRGLDFSTSLNQIISRNTDIATSESNLDLVRARNIPTKFAFFPTLSLTASLPLSDNFLTSPQSIAINSQWNLFRWGADYFGLISAGSAEDSQKSAVDATILAAEKDAIQALISEIQRIKEVNINSNITKNQTELLAIAQQRYKSGFLSLQEVEKLTVDLANAKASLADSKMNEIQARAHLESLLGQSEIITEWPWIAQFKSARVPAILHEEFQLTHRPDWQEAHDDVQSQSYKLSQKWRLLLPSVDAQFSFGNYSGYFGSFTGWVGTVSVSIPLFDQLANYSNAKAQSAIRATSETKLERIQRDAKSQWDAARAGFKVALESALAREETLELSKKLFQDNFRRFQAGRITANDLTIDRVRMNSAELFAVQSWSAVHLNYADLCHSLGYRVESCLNR